MRKDAKDLINQLVARITKAQKAYYAGSPVISDAEYDALEAQLKAIDPNAVVLKSVGKAQATTARILHVRPMLSIENYYTPESFVDATKSYGSVLLIEPKRDGISCELSYINNTLVQAVTRGDGLAGEDMLAQVKACKKIPQVLARLCAIKNIRLRGELVMRNSELARINSLGGKQYANARNLTAGTMKNTPEIVRTREIVFVPWDMYSPDQDNLLPDSAYDRMQLAFGYGFSAYDGEKVNRQNSSEIIKALHSILKKNETSDITADGVVVKADSHKVRNSLGVASKFTRYQHCFKPQNLSSTTELLGIEYGLGRTGKVTPVALLKPVNLGGAMVARASVNNETYMEALGLTIGCTVEILRSGDVIPFIVKVIKKGTTKISFPTHCPSCKTKLAFDASEEIVQRFCPNNNCTGKAAKQFAYIGNRETLEIDNLGESMAEELVSHNINSISDLFLFGNSIVANPLQLEKQFTFRSEKQFNFRSNVNVRKMVKSLQNAKTATWDRWIASLNIPMIGHSLGKDISKALNLGPENMKNLPNFLKILPSMNLEKLGPEKTAAIVEWVTNKDNVMLCTRLYDAGVRPTPLTAPKVSAGAPLAGIVICMTGELSMGTRKEVGVKLEALGAEIVDDVKSNCNLVIVGDKPGSKLAKAQKKGIKIVDDAWVRKTLGL